MRDTTRCSGWGLQAILLLAAVAGCSGQASVSFNLINPCQEDVLFAHNQCQFMEICVSSLDPQDPLHPANIANGLGPRCHTCSFAEGNCDISGDDIDGPARIVDLRCRTTLDGPAMARATSQSLVLGSGSGALGSVSMNLQLGNVNSFTETTVVDPRSSQLGTCSMMGQGEIGRYGHTATLLADGRVLIAGGIRRYGQGLEEVLATAEIFDPVTGTHQMITDRTGNPVKMAAPSGRAFHTATRLRDGRVLLAGGVGLVDGKRTTLQSAELFDPSTNSFGTISVMGSGRAHHVATMLATGEVLVTGGAAYQNGEIVNYFNSALRYLPGSNSWEAVQNNMSAARAFHAAVLLDPTKYNGNVLIVGGEDQNGPLSSIDVYNAQANQFYQGVDVTMNKNRSHLCAVTLQNGDVLVAGGKTTEDDTSVDSGVEIYNPGVPTYGEFRDLELNLTVARMDHTCSLLDNGNVLVAGGKTSSATGVQVGEMVLVGSGTYTVEQIAYDVRDPPRFQHQATSLQNGWVLLTGGLPSDTPDSKPATQSMYFVPEPSF